MSERLGLAERQSNCNESTAAPGQSGCQLRLRFASHRLRPQIRRNSPSHRTRTSMLSPGCHGLATFPFERSGRAAAAQQRRSGQAEHNLNYRLGRRTGASGRLGSGLTSSSGLTIQDFSRLWRPAASSTPDPRPAARCGLARTVGPSDKVVGDYNTEPDPPPSQCRPPPCKSNHKTSCQSVKKEKIV